MSVRISFSAIRANSRIKPTNDTRLILAKLTQSFAQAIVDETKEYPSAVSGYRRTYQLFRSWQVRDISTGDGIRWQIQNPAYDKWGRFYSGLVHGPSSQWYVHAGHGWKNIGDVLENAGGRELFRREVQEIINRQLGV